MLVMRQGQFGIIRNPRPASGHPGIDPALSHRPLACAMHGTHGSSPQVRLSQLDKEGAELRDENEHLHKRLASLQEAAAADWQAQVGPAPGMICHMNHMTQQIKNRVKCPFVLEICVYCSHAAPRFASAWPRIVLAAIAFRLLCICWLCQLLSAHGFFAYARAKGWE